MQHLNYCRQFKKFSRHIDFEGIDNKEKEVRDYIALVDLSLGLIQNAQKFILPPGGRITGDIELRAIDENEDLRLPYPITVFEYHLGHDSSMILKGQSISTKRIIITWEDDEVRKGTPMIMCMPVCYIDNQKTWQVLKPCGLPMGDAIKRDGLGTRVNIQYPDTAPENVEIEYMEDLSVVLDTINALTCSNVRIDESEPKKIKIKKDPYEFDSYKYLVLENRQSVPTGEERSWYRQSREHLRRGHIRHCASGVKTWVNACVVNSGKGGVVSKDYGVAL